MAKASAVVGIDASTTLGDAAGRILVSRIADLLDWVPRVFDESDVRGLHDCRIATKRVRYALESLGDGLGEDFDAKSFTSASVDLQEALGAVTDCDAHLSRLDAEAERTSHPEGLAALRMLALQERANRWREARALLVAQAREGVWSRLLRAISAL